ncbi:efflux RND transporter permease subunit [Rhodovarius lipocyclicus]|uniref:efflux RND transporter permease subunit n=1 Tax=Rhodovarius lipocyclicus TaxID=268410 RepID=UPI001356EBCD|nr:efflux RND transporter permease subunit [Rhodovarius lipocyclicus]
MHTRINPSEWAIRNGALTLFAMILVLAMGFMAWNRLGRAEDPGFTIKVMVIQAQWPGASAAEVQDQVLDRIEGRLQDLAFIDTLQSFSRPGVGTITLTLRDDTPARLVADLWYQVRKKVGDMRAQLPSGVIGPFFNDEYSDVYSAVIALTGADNAELARQGERLRIRLRRIPGVEKVVLDGEQPQRVHVEVSHARLATLGIAPDVIITALQRHNPVTPGGTVETGSTRINLRLPDGLDGIESVGATPIPLDGRTIRLADIATITRGVADPPSTAIRFRRDGAVLLSVVKERGVDVLRLGAALEAELDRIRRELPAGLALSLVSDQPHIVRESVNEFLVKLGAALGVVLVISFLSLGFRPGIIVALSVPLTLSLVFAFMLWRGTELERISLGALILALGLLVDDAIIAIEAMLVKLEQGWDKVRAAGFAWTSTAGPMLTGTLMTVAGFIPVGFANSTSGEYAGGIFWVVGAALIASWVVAVVFTPWLGAAMLRVAPHIGHDPYQGRFSRVLRAAVSACVRFRWLVMALTVALLVVGFVGMGMTRKQFFPVSQRLEILVDVDLRQGASFGATDDVIRRLEAAVADDPDVRHYTAYLGAGAPRFFLALNPDLPNEAFGKLIIETRDLAARERLRSRLIQMVQDGAFTEARVRVSRLDFGPPVSYPVQFRLMGPDANVLRRLGDEWVHALNTVPGARAAQTDWNERAPAVRLELDLPRLAQLGLSPQAVANSLGALISGVTATQIREGNRQVDVVLRAPPEERMSLSQLPDLTLATPAGPVPLSQVARLVPAMEEPILWRRNREPFITIRSDILPGYQAPDVTNAALPLLAPLVAALPPGYRMEVGGALEQSAKANASLFVLFPVMLAVMAALLMLQLRHFGRAALVFATAPLGIPGAAAALLLFDAPFGFVALLGVIALAGMIMRNTLILVDQVQQDLEAGHDLREAIVESAVRRARPVVLTALAAILAFIPLTQSAFWGPMAAAMIGGLTVATVVTLFVVPALYGLALRQPAREPEALPTPAE